MNNRNNNIINSNSSNNIEIDWSLKYTELNKKHQNLIQNFNKINNANTSLNKLVKEQNDFLTENNQIIGDLSLTSFIDNREFLIKKQNIKNVSELLNKFLDNEKLIDSYDDNKIILTDELTKEQAISSNLRVTNITLQNKLNETITK